MVVSKNVDLFTWFRIRKGMEKSRLQRARVERFKLDQQHKVLEEIEDSRRLQ